MGGLVSVAAFDAAHVRIYNNIIGIRNPRTRVEMIQTCLAAPEYVIAAKRAGVYSYLLAYVSAVSSGQQPRPLPGEGSGVATAATPAVVPPRSIAGGPGFADSLASGVGRPSPPQVRHELTTYQEKAPVSPWQQITATPKQKMVSYFSSCLEVLGIQEEVAITEDTLKKAYKRAALRAHPDKGGSEEHFEAITRAYAYLSEILKRMNGGRAVAVHAGVEAPSVLDTSRQKEAKAWQHAEPVRLNPKNLDMNVFNQLFEQTHIPDPDQDGYGDWLKDSTGQKSTAPKFSGKFNRDVFNSVFEQEAQRAGAAGGSLIVHPEAMALGPTMGVEIGSDRPADFTAAANSKNQFTDLRSAYTTESTITDKVANVRVEERRYDTYKASREKGPDPYNAEEQRQLAASAAALKAREDSRQRRAAERGIMENDYFERMKRLVITDK